MTDRVFLLFIILTVLGGFLGAQEAPLAEEPEAPEALFEQKIGDVGVVIEADGTWTTRMAAGWGQGFSPLGTFPSLGYPGMEKGGVFAQQPDFSLTLRLLERYYFEVVYGGSLEDRTFLVGYQGQPGEFVQWAKAGNTPFSVAPRAGQTLSEGRRGAPAAGLALTAGPVNLDLLARYEDGTRESRTYQGYREVSAAQVAIDQWIRGRFFQVPADQLPLTGLRILVADPAGVSGDDGNRYREASASEVTANPATGAIRLSVEAQRRFLVTWDNAASWLASAPESRSLLGLVAHQVLVQGDRWVVLVQPGTPSPLEQRNLYALPSGTQGSVRLVEKKSGTPVPGFTVGQSVVQDWFEVSGAAEAPFYASLPALYPHGPGVAGFPPPATSALPWVFQLPSAAPATQFSLGPDLLPSSVIVLRNGIPTEAFRFDGKAGTLSLDTPVFDTDRIDISYQRAKSGAKASDLVLWQGGRWDPAPEQGVEWAFQGRWNMEQGRFTTEDLQSPGTVSASLSYEGRAEAWNWRLAATAGALLTDSTGHRRLYGFASEGTQADLNGDSLRPSAVPSIAGLTEPGRAALVYRNYWSSDPLTGTPQVSAWGKAGVAAEPSVADGPVGPYLVRGDGQRSDRLAVLEATLGPGQWAALQVFLDQGLPRDLKSVSAVTVNLRVPGGLGAGDKVYLQAGTLSEDWDGSGALRSLEYRQVPALAFQDASRGSRYFPVPESSSWGNDANRDGTAGADGSLVTIDLTAAGSKLVPGTTDWLQLRTILGDEDRQRLQRTTGWRLVLVQGSGAFPQTQTVLVGPVVFEGSTWTVAPDASAGSGSVNPVQQADPGDQERQQLRIDWSDRSAWSVEGRHPSLRPAAYRTLRFRYKLDAPSGTTVLRLAVTDADGHGIEAVWPATATAAWVQGTIDLRQHTLLLDGQEKGTVSSTPGAEIWDRAVLSKTGSSPAGTLVLADIEATDPVWEPVGNSLATAQWKQTGAWPSAAWPVFSGMTWTGVSRQSGLTADDLVWRGVTTLSGNLGPVRAVGEASFVRTALERQGHGSYEASLPLGWAGGPRLEWTDRFSDQGLRAEKLVLVLPWLGTWEGQVQAKGPPRTLDQDYSLGWSATAAPGWEASTTARWSQSRPRTTELNSFAETWRDSWNWLVPEAETAPYYLLQGQQEAKATWEPWSLVLKAQSQAAQSLGTDLKWTAWGGWEVRAPFRPAGVDSFTLTPSLSKSVEAVYTGRSPLEPLDSARDAAGRLWTTPGALGALPFSEQDTALTPWPTDSGFQTGKVQSTAGLDWERTAVSDWTDLVVPATAGIQTSTTRVQDGMSRFQSGAVKASVQAKALNLFGALGSVPVFSWYRTDVWAWAATAGWGTGTRAEDQNSDGSLTVRSDLVLTPEESLGVPATYQGRWGPSGSQSLRLQPTWTLRRPADLPFELPRWLSPSAFHRQWVQDLAVSLDLGWQPVPSPTVRDLQVSWKGRLLLSEKSELTTTVRWGQQWQTNLTVVGLEAALELVLNF